MVPADNVLRFAITQAWRTIDDPADDGGLLSQTQILPKRAVLMQISLVVVQPTTQWHKDQHRDYPTH